MQEMLFINFSCFSRVYSLEKYIYKEFRQSTNLCSNLFKFFLFQFWFTCKNFFYRFISSLLYLWFYRFSLRKVKFRYIWLPHLLLLYYLLLLYRWLLRGRLLPTLLFLLPLSHNLSHSLSISSWEFFIEWILWFRASIWTWMNLIRLNWLSELCIKQISSLFWTHSSA